MRARRRVMFFAGTAIVLACAAVLGGAAIPGQAAGPANQKVEAALACEPGTVAPGAPIGCMLTVANKGGNAVNNTTVTVTASGGSFDSTTVPASCTISSDGLVLTCTVGKLNAVNTAGSSFTATYELLAPASGEEVTQTIEGRYSSSTPNKRGNDLINVTSDNPFPTELNGSPDFDGKFSNNAADSVQTDPISTGNPYSTGATLGTTGFAVGLTVEEKAAGANNPNCPSTGCFGGQVIDFNITPLDGVFPQTFQLTIQVYVGPGVQATALDVKHDTFDVSLCSASVQTDPKGACVFSRTVVNSTKIATIVINGLGPGNGGWGVG